MNPLLITDLFFRPWAPVTTKSTSKEGPCRTNSAQLLCPAEQEWRWTRSNLCSCNTEAYQRQTTKVNTSTGQVIFIQILRIHRNPLVLLVFINKESRKIAETEHTKGSGCLVSILKVQLFCSDVYLLLKIWEFVSDCFGLLRNILLITWFRFNLVWMASVYPLGWEEGKKKQDCKGSRSPRSKLTLGLIWKQRKNLWSLLFSLDFSLFYSSESATTEPAALEEPDSKRRKLEEERAKAPLMPFGLDLHYWGQDQPSAGKILK